jgi:hypothetical protein
MRSVIVLAAFAIVAGSEGVPTETIAEPVRLLA